MTGPGLKPMASVLMFGCLCARDNQKNRQTNKSTDAVVQRTAIDLQPNLTFVYILTDYNIKTAHDPLLVTMTALTMYHVIY